MFQSSKGNSFKVSSIPISKVIADLASQLKTNFTEKCGEYSLDVPKSFGFGKISGYVLGNGVGFIHYFCSFKEETEIDFSAGSVQPLKFLYCRSGSLVHRFAQQEGHHKIHQYQQLAVASSGNNGHVIKFSAGSLIELLSVEVLRSEFVDQIDNTCLETTSVLRDLLLDKDAVNTYISQGSFNVDMARKLSELNSAMVPGLVKYVFFQTKTYELLHAHFMFLNQDARVAEPTVLLASEDAKIIYNVTEYISANLAEPPNSEQLSRKFGLSRSSLYAKFKKFHGMTVIEYLTTLRMEMAFKYLTTTDYPISEIANIVGFTNHGYFSKKVAKFYGLPPRKLRTMEIEGKSS